MNKSLIQVQKSRFFVFIDVALTLFGWMILADLLIGGIYANISDENSIPIKSAWPGSLITLVIYLLFMIFFSLVLAGWAKYNYMRFGVERRSRREDLSKKQLIQTFEVTEHWWNDLQLAKVAVVHHDDKARIVGIDVDLKE